MKKSILVVLLVLLAFTIWSVLAFGKAKRDEGVKQPTEIEKAEPGPAPEDFPEVVLPRPGPARPTAEDYQTVLDKKGKTPEQMKELQGEAVPVEFESQPQKAPYYCEVRNQVGGAYYRPGGDWNLYCWGQLGLATLLNLDFNYWTDCPYPLYPFEITDVAVQVYAAGACTFWSSARIYNVDYSGGTPYPNAQISTPGGPQMDNHPGAFLWIVIPIDPPCFVFNEFFAAWMFDNSDDFNDIDYCTPTQFVDLSLIFDASGRTGQSYWGPYAEYTGEPYYGWFDVVPNGLWPGALRIEVLGYTADQNEGPFPPETWYFKEGMPDFSQYNEAFPNAGSSYCAPTAGANSIWWFSCVKEYFEPSWGGCLEGDEIALVNEIAAASGTDPVLGTNCDLLQEGIINTIYAHGGWWFYEQTTYAPDFWYIQKELRACEDIVLLLGFWQEDPSAGWYRFGGHFVTLAGVDIYNLAFAFSDPATPPGYDQYFVAWPSASPGGIVFIPDYYVDWPDFQGQNAGPFPNDGTYDGGLAVHVEVEQVIDVSPGPRFMNGEIESSQVYEIDNNYGGIAAGSWQVAFNGVDWVEGGYYGSYLLGTSQGDLNCSYGDYNPVHSFEPLAAPVRDTFTITGAAGDYFIEQLTLKFKHTDYDIFITEYVFGFWVPEGGTMDCELVIEHIFVLENRGATDVLGLQSGIINDIDIGDNACLMSFDPQHNSMWMYEGINDNLVFGMTKLPAIVGDYAVTGWGLSNPARIYDGQYVDSLFIWMQSGTWQLDDVGTGDDMSFLFADVPFDLLAGQVRIEGWLKWGYPGTIAASGDANWRYFLYNILHQEGFYRGDVNKDGSLNISDVIYMINYLFKGGASPLEFADQMDVNCDDQNNISDVIYTINYLFKAGPAPKDENRFVKLARSISEFFKGLVKRVIGLFGDPAWKDLGDKSQQVEEGCCWRENRAYCALPPTMSKWFCEYHLDGQWAPDSICVEVEDGRYECRPKPK